ncbi:hypothetical protein [Dactylosporangium sp. NPDC048998]|uniref:hypothetical protein n=1 Tax=Dactylosporangium sp. NPDC048998 TaxID=3363976 RepID=UPI003713A148
MTARPMRGRTLLAGSLAAFTAAAGLVAGVTGPAAADPSTGLAGVGSATTQYVMDAIATSIGLGYVGSWDAVDPATGAVLGVIQPKPGCTMTRPNSSATGIAALRKSINPNTTAPQLSDPPEAGCVDFARSGLPPSAADVSANGGLIYMPFGLDGIAVATGPSTAVTGTDPAVATAIVNADQFTVANLRTLYRTCGSVTVGGVTYTPDGTVTDATHQPVHLYLPGAGTDTALFWAQTFAFNASSPPSCIHRQIVGTSTNVDEGDGAVLAADPTALCPFPIAEWISQNRGHHDKRHNAVLRAMVDSNGVSQPARLGSGVLNAQFPVRHEVYNVVSYNQLAGPDKNALVASVFGASSGVCSNSAQILSYGFGLLASAPLGHTCGQIASDLRALDPSFNPV